MALIRERLLEERASIYEKLQIMICDVK